MKRSQSWLSEKEYRLVTSKTPISTVDSVDGLSKMTYNYKFEIRKNV